MTSTAKLIGIAGLIGSGKSAVVDFLAQQGYPILKGDDEAHILYRKNKSVRTMLANAYGADNKTPSGVDRAKLGALVFANPEQLLILERIIHPILAQHLEKKMRALAKGVNPPKAVFLEGALLPKWTALIAKLDEVWIIDASEDIRFKRIVARGLSQPEARKRIVQQRTFPMLVHKHCVKIKNEGSLQALQQKVQSLLSL